MAIDTAAKRSSSLDHEEPWQCGAPLPDGTIGQGDRQHSIWSYSGILAGASSLETLVGHWANVIDIASPNERINIKSSNKRLDIHGANQRIEI